MLSVSTTGNGRADPRAPSRRHPAGKPDRRHAEIARLSKGGERLAELPLVENPISPSPGRAMRDQLAQKHMVKADIVADRASSSRRRRQG